MLVHSEESKDSISTTDGTGNGLELAKMPAAAEWKAQNRAPMLLIMRTPMVESVSNLLYSDPRIHKPYRTI